MNAMTESMPSVGRSAKQELVLTAERLYARHGLDGVPPLRRIGVEAGGMANKSAVQYHFGSKQGLIDAILINRVEDLTRRRSLLEARLPATDLRSVVEAHQLPLIELAEDEDCYYLPFLEQLVREMHPPWTNCRRRTANPSAPTTPASARSSPTCRNLCGTSASIRPRRPACT